MNKLTKALFALVFVGALAPYCAADICTQCTGCPDEEVTKSIDEQAQDETKSVEIVEEVEAVEEAE